MYFSGKRGRFSEDLLSSGLTYLYMGFAIIVVFDFEIEQLVVKTTLLYSDLKEDILVTPQPLKQLVTTHGHCRLAPQNIRSLSCAL